MEGRSNKQEIAKRRKKQAKWYANWMFITASIIFIIALFIAAGSYHQATHFNSQVKLNGINVGGLTAGQALNKLKTVVLKNVIYVGDHQILDGKDTKMAFSDQDLPNVKELLKSQWTFFPSSKVREYSLPPSNQDQHQSGTLKKQLKEKLNAMNKGLKAPQDATVRVEQGKIIVTNSISGEKYDVESVLKEFDEREYGSEIRLNPVYRQPMKEDSEFIKNQQKKFEEFLAGTVDYKVQDKVFTLKASDFIKSASISKDLQIKIEDAGDIKNQIAKINNSKSTLNKNFTFKTHSGSVISVKGEGYGYETSANNGIGDTYAEVSLSNQHIWIYKNGKLVVSTNVVTGTHDNRHETSPGVWYILYKQSPSVLTGRENGKITYQVDVNYWAPFTNDGQGFHDAGWRGNWGSKAYLTAGSHGCINTPPGIMKTVYDNLSTYEPVVIY